MFLVADTTQPAPPTYLISGDLAVLLQDELSIAGLRAVGIPLVQMSPENITSVSTALAPPS